jgi:DNA-binding LacI/PurR family transcriptional regulator
LTIKPAPADPATSVPEGNHRRIQMADLARIAGVSTTTVSRALSGSPLVNAATRDRVAELARQLKYTVNAGAKALRLGQRSTVAVVIPFAESSRQDLYDPFFLSILGSLANALTSRGYEMLLSRIDASDLGAASLPVDSGRASGIVLVGQWGQHDQLNQLAERGVPLVVWGARLPAQRYCTVGGDNVGGGRQACAHLLSRGRRHIAFLGDTALPEVAQRHQGYLEALQAQGLGAQAELHVGASFLPQAGREAIDTLNERGVPYDGLVCCSDLLAMAAIGRLQETGRRVPGDVAVVGYDDVAMAAHFHPPITSINQAIDEGARALVDQLMGGSAPGAAQSVTLPTHLVVRAST